MYIFRIIILSISIFSFLGTKGQSVIVEFTLPSNDIENIRSYVTGQNIYLLYDDYKSKSDAVESMYQIKPDGTSKQLHLKQTEGTVFVGVQDVGDSSLFYFLVGKKKNVSLQAMMYNHITEEGTWLEKEIEMDGSILGISNEEIFSIILYNKELNQLKVLQLNQFKIVNEKSFELPVNLINDYKYISYIQDDLTSTIGEGSAKFKLYKKDKQLILSVDHTFYESSSTDPQTTVMKFDLESGTQSIHRLPTKSKYYFRSFINNDLLYRSAISKKRFQLEVVDISTGKTIQTKEIVRDSTLKEKYVYIRNGKTHRISKKESLYDMMSTSGSCEPSVIALPENDSCNTTIIWSTFYADENGIGSPAGMATNPIAGILTLIGGTATRQMKKPTTISRYFYLSSNCKNELVDDQTQSKSQRQRIDEYEISLDEQRIFYKDKVYFTFQKNVVGIYYSERTLKLTLVKF